MNIKKQTTTLLALVLATSIPSVFAMDAMVTDSSTMKHNSMTTKLMSLGDSGMTGEVFFSSKGDKTEVTVMLSRIGKDAVYPAHIHEGACPVPGAVKYPLSDIVDGKSVTMIDVSSDQLWKMLPLAINVHKSPTEMKSYVACGDLKTKMKSDTSMNMNLMMGSQGDDIITLQTFLESQGFLKMPNGVAKGFFGKSTKRALMKYQKSEGISSTGNYGAITRAKVAKHMMMKDSMMKKDAMMDKAEGEMSDGVMVGGSMMISTRDIVDNAVLANNVTTVVAAVKAAGLVDTLKSKGPFTVFAPNNAAFAALPSGTVETLLKPENKAKLVDILTYHVVAGTYKMKDLYDGQMLTTVEGKTLKITKVNGVIMINGTAMIETPNVISSNGVTHVINAVLLP